MAHPEAVVEGAAEAVGTRRLLLAVQKHCVSLGGLSAGVLGGLQLGPITTELIGLSEAFDAGSLTDAQVRRILRIRAQLWGASAFMASCSWALAVNAAEDADQAAQQQPAAAAAAAAAAPAEAIAPKAVPKSGEVAAAAAKQPPKAAAAPAAAAAAAPAPLVPRPPAGPPPKAIGSRHWGLLGPYSR